MPRGRIEREATLRVGVLRVTGRVLDVGVGGVFFASSLLVETGERGTIELPSGAMAAVRVAWIRGPSHPSGPGIGMAFEMHDARDERRALELVLGLLDDADAVADAEPSNA